MALGGLISNKGTATGLAAGSNNLGTGQNAGGAQATGTGTGEKKPYYNPGKERSKLEKKVKRAEEELAVKEERLEALKAELLRPEYQSCYSKLTEIQGQIDAMEEEIMADMEVWEELSSQYEALLQEN